MRIVSLLPSATEIICHIGLRDQLVGVTHECDYPPEVVRLPRVTQTLVPREATSREIDQLVRERLTHRRALYSLDRSVLERLAPDLLVTQALCDVCAVAEEEVHAAACALPGQPRVVNLEPKCLADVYDSLRLVGDQAGVSALAEAAVQALQARVEVVIRRTRTLPQLPRVVLLEWIDPPFSCGHWSPELVTLAGGIEGIGQAGEPSRTIDVDVLRQVDPQVLVIACCGFDVERTLKDLAILREYPGFREWSCVRDQRVYVLDGNAYFSRPGPRLVDGLEILAHTLHPTVHPLPVGGLPARRLTNLELGLTAVGGG